MTPEWQNGTNIRSRSKINPKLQQHRKLSIHITLMQNILVVQEIIQLEFSVEKVEDP